MFDELTDDAGRRAVQHGYFGTGAEGSAQSDRFIQMRNKKGAATGGGEGRGHRSRAETVGVGLDHGGALRRRSAGRQQAPIRDDGPEVDFENRTGATRRVSHD